MAKKIWKALDVTYESTNQVKKTKINILLHNYKIFRIKLDKTIKEMFTQFTNIVNKLEEFGKIYSKGALIRSIFKSFHTS